MADNTEERISSIEMALLGMWSTNLVSYYFNEIYPSGTIGKVEIGPRGAPIFTARFRVSISEGIPMLDIMAESPYGEQAKHYIISLIDTSTGELKLKTDHGQILELHRNNGQF